MVQFSLKPNRYIGVCCIFLLFLAILPAQAAKRSSGWPITLLISGLGMQVGSTYLNTSAENLYEDYLSASLQTDIQQHKSDSIARKNASVIMSRVGYGCIGLAVILSIFNQLDSATDETVTFSQITDKTNLNTLYPISLSSTSLSLNNRILGEPQKFSFRPHYDFQGQRASLQFLHRF